MTDETKEDLGAWKDEVIDALVICGIYRAEHEHKPHQALVDLLNWHWETAQRISFEEASDACTSLIPVACSTSMVDVSRNQGIRACVDAINRLANPKGEQG